MHTGEHLARRKPGGALKDPMVATEPKYDTMAKQNPHNDGYGLEILRTENI